MKRFRSLLKVVLCGLVVVVGASFARADETAADATAASHVDLPKFVSTYCVSCHGDELQEADRQFDQLVSAGAIDTTNRETWREVLDRLNLGDMPPDYAEAIPSDDERLKTINALTAELSKRVESADGHEPVALRRLNRLEYDRSVRALLGLEEMLVDPTSAFAPDETAEGFDNVAESLVVSDFLLKRYLAAADEYLDRAIDRAATSDSPDRSRTKRFTAPFYKEGNVGDGLNRDGEYMHIRENSSDTGGFLWLQKFRRGVAEPGYYTIRVRASAVNREYPLNEDIIGVPREDPLVMSFVASDATQSANPRTNHATDRTLAEFEVADDHAEWYETTAWLDRGYLVKFGYPNGPRRIKYMRHRLMREHREHFPRFLTECVPVFSNMHPDYDKVEGPKLEAVFLDEQEELRKAGKPYAVFGTAHLLNDDKAWRTFYSEYRGPRIRVFEIEISGPEPAKNVPEVVRAITPSGGLDDDEAGLRALREFAEGAARRPLGDDEFSPIERLYTNAREGASIAASLRLSYKAVLCSTMFLYHRTSAGPLNDYELASRLSFFLTGGPPDAELLAAADAGQLRNGEVLRAHTDRLLDEHHTRDFVERFSNAWLKLAKLGTMLPDSNEHVAYYNERLERAMRDETTHFLADAFTNNRPVRSLIDGRTTFLNAPLARLYGIEGVAGFAMRPVELTDPKRGGLLGQASVLTTSANGIDTSPVVRGVWVLECLLGTPPSPPPPDVEPIEPDIRGATTIREQLAKHREVASCKHCHKRIDPYGFALESFDEIGQFRTVYNQNEPSWRKKAKPPVDPSGKLSSGEPFDDIVGLRVLLTKQTRLITRNLASRLLTLATGRVHDPADAADVLTMSQPGDSSDESTGVRDLLHRVVQCEAFRR